jgi:hypothetical protein
MIRIKYIYYVVAEVCAKLSGNDTQMEIFKEALTVHRVTREVRHYRHHFFNV